jgi:hypothetical protein
MIRNWLLHCELISCLLLIYTHFPCLSGSRFLACVVSPFTRDLSCPKGAPFVSATSPPTEWRLSSLHARLAYRTYTPVQTRTTSTCFRVTKTSTNTCINWCDCYRAPLIQRTECLHVNLPWTVYTVCHLFRRWNYCGLPIPFTSNCLEQSLCSNFLGAFEKLRKATISCVMCMSVCLSARMQQLSSHWTDFYETWNLSIFRKSVEKIQVSLKSDNNNGYFPRRPKYIYDNISLNSSQNEKYFRQIL